MKNIEKNLSPKLMRWIYLGLYVFFIITIIFNTQILRTFRFLFATILLIWVIILQFNDLKEKNIKLGTEIKIIAKEIINYMWFYIIISLTILLYYSKIIGDSTPTNQESVNNILNNNPSIFYMIFVAVLGPMIEEAIFRFLPYNSFNNKIFFILVSGFIFAFLHCIDDPNPFTYLPFYLLPSLYLGYRYYKTEDIFVTMSIHILINISSLK